MDANSKDLQDSILLTKVTRARRTSMGEKMLDEPRLFDQIDLFRLSDDSHHTERLRRKQRVQLGELNRGVWIPTAEDVIIQKLRWPRRKDLDDVVNILAVRAGKLDWDYLSKWTHLHGTYDLLDQLRKTIPDIDLGGDDALRV